jgi:Fe-S oxidoreductase
LATDATADLFKNAVVEIAIPKLPPEVEMVGASMRRTGRWTHRLDLMNE